MQIALNVAIFIFIMISKMFQLLLELYIGWLAHGWPLVKHLDVLWLIFLKQYLFGCTETSN